MLAPFMIVVYFTCGVLLDLIASAPLIPNSLAHVPKASRSYLKSNFLSAMNTDKKKKYISTPFFQHTKNDVGFSPQL
jgi:hypothetical protein